MELLLLVFFCLLTGSEVTFGAGTTVTVDKGKDVTLPCSLREDITNKKFEWKKDGRQVFLYDDRDHSNIVNTGQDQQFLRRVEHFPAKLKSGDASITISNSMVADSGNYTCEFPDLQPRQIFYIKLIVYVEAPKPSVRILDQTLIRALLQCEVRGAFPKPELHWQDGDGNKLPAEKPQESEREGLYDIILITTVTKTDYYRCVSTQKEINHQIHAETYVHLTVASPKPSVRILEQRDKSATLQCEVRGAFPKPELHWQDRAGNKLEADEPQESERGGLFYIILNTTVYKTDYYRCVVTQEEINHQTHDETYVHIPVLTAGETAAIVIGVVVVAVGLAMYRWRYRIISFFMKVAAKPSVRILEQTDFNAELQCEVRGAFPKPELHWEDGAGNKLHAPKPQERERGGHYDIILQLTVTKTGNYRCVVTQKEINYHTYVETYVHIPGPAELNPPTTPGNGSAQDGNEGGPIFITVEEGRRVMLPCSLNTTDITNKKFEWKKDGLRQVFLYDKGDHSNNVNTGQDQQFRGRVEHFPDELKSGDASIIISNMKLADSGVYTCEFPDHQPSQLFYIVLDVVRPEIISVKEGRDVTLPCSLYPEDITNKKFEWMKDGRQVFLYDDGDHSNTGQDQLFKGRVSHFRDKLKSGSASITIRNTQWVDRGYYICIFPDLQPEQIFRMKLDVVGPEIISVKEGRDVTLPCSLSTKEDITKKKFVWMQDGLRRVFRYDDGDHSNTGQDQLFKGRVKHFPGELKSGSASITISNMKVTDSGLYICTFPDLQPSQLFRIMLVVGPKVITVKEGRGVTLPCSLSPEDITNKKFEWKKDGRQVFRYDDRYHSNNVPTDQDQQFEGRVSHFPDKLKSGIASIAIRNTKVFDTGLYTCEFPDLQPEQIFYVKLLVFEPAELTPPTALTTPGNGSAQDGNEGEPAAPNPCDDETAGLLTERKKTDGGDVEAGLQLIPLNKNQPPNEVSRF